MAEIQIKKTKIINTIVYVIPKIPGFQSPPPANDPKFK